jgi:hypothetical protein
MATVAPEYSQTFDDLGADVLHGAGPADAGATAAAGSAGGFAASTEGGGGVPFLTFDFRRGAQSWPVGVTMIDELEQMQGLSETVCKELAEALKQQEDDADKSGSKDGKDAGSSGPPSKRGASTKPADSWESGVGGGGVGMQLSSDSSNEFASSDDEGDNFDANGFLAMRKPGRKKAQAATPAGALQGCYLRGSRGRPPGPLGA